MRRRPMSTLLLFVQHTGGATSPTRLQNEGAPHTLLKQARAWNKPMLYHTAEHTYIAAESTGVPYRITYSNT